ncbi:MAG TPA: TIGR02300 family protein [Xanthobacteraceae bacterium]|nr:TIGR02300 family protein [Xanthobacteraceae bacterium]
MAKPELGTKRLCASCGAKFYDLSKTPPVCPSCGTVFEVIPVVTRARPDQARAAAARAPEVEVPEPQEAELISLEEADAEQQGKKSAVADADVGDDVDTGEDIEDGDEEPFIEEQEEEDTDVSEIIGGDIADEEES